MASDEKISSAYTGVEESRPHPDVNLQQRQQQQHDLDAKRRAALAQIDNAKFGWFHIRACMVAGIGFFTDAYDLFAINLVSAMLGYVYFADNKNKVPKDIDLGLKASAAAGTFIGQLVFGWLADRLGRKRMYGIELMIIVVATLGSALSGNSFAVTVSGTLIFWRVILGVGIGGDYPLSAVITSEFATTKNRGAMIGAVFAMQGFGILAAAIVSVVVLAAYKGSIRDNVQNVDYCWRLVLGLGAVPGMVALYFRLTIPETPRYTMDIERDIERATKDINSVLVSGTYEKPDPDAPVTRVEAPKHTWADFVNYFGKWENGKILLGTSLSWFTLDVAYYGISLNNSIILRNIGFSGGSDPYTALQKIAVGNVLIALMGTVPGYWFTVFFVDKWGRKPIQLMGFANLTIIFIILGFWYHQIINVSTTLFIAIFTLSQFFQNFGPNSTTFIIPGEVFPTRYRSTGHGISAASGKLGAVIAQVGFTQMKDIGGTEAFVPNLIKIFAIFMFLGLLSTLLIPETKGLTLEELSNEDQKGFVKGISEKKK
ncbi:hypothetical protein G9A89_006335 [Geosiphon pyriformis]|nr:hypothetical protein G9A89_006335 [Geosiphon pyriformis]